MPHPEVAFIFAGLQVGGVPPEQFIGPPGPLGRMPFFVVGPTLLLQPRYIPTEFTFALVIGLRGIAPNSEEPPRLGLRLLAPNSQVVFESQPIPLRFHPESGYPAVPDEDVQAVVGLNLQNLLLPLEGHYSMVVEVDGVTIGTQTLAVWALSRGGVGNDVVS